MNCLAEWRFARPLLPVSLRGRKRPDDHRALKGMVGKFRTGTPWRNLPTLRARRCTRVFAGGRRTLSRPS
ncbi:transposase [Streptomyces sp. NPDC126499]|uniref:transposase n=1 Tax=Streptomyces sp. NPDC126499 TaxID=3155314 RepID=UPI003327D35E